MKYFKKFVIPLLIGYIISVSISLLHWVGVIVGMIIGGYFCKEYKYSFLVGLIGGLTVWPTIFLIKIIFYGAAASKAYAIVGIFFYIAIIFGLILALISTIIGTALRNIVDSLKE